MFVGGARSGGGDFGKVEPYQEAQRRLPAVGAASLKHCENGNFVLEGNGAYTECRRGRLLHPRMCKIHVLSGPKIMGSFPAG